MGSDDVDDQWGIVARLDIVAWQMHDGESPEVTYPGADARARRWHAVLLIVAGVLIALGAVMFLGQVVHEALPVVGAVAVFPLAGVAMFAAARHRHYRYLAGVPVIGPVRDPLAVVAAWWKFGRDHDRELIELIELNEGLEGRAAALAKARQDAAKTERSQRRFARRVIALCELAARADARGRRRARQRNILRIWVECWPVLQRLHAANERLKQEEQQEQGAPPGP